MDYEKLRRRLLETARRNPPSDRVPYAFERRIMANLPVSGRSDASALAFWTRGFWRGALSGVAAAGIMMGSLGVVSDRGMEEVDMNSGDSLEEALLASTQAEVEL
ncbi:MAG: hypothetical protein JNL10_06840 [Verrucomicrobiales bacterium]|nr:hypothetical protein [Verrucomicrobiales bacterium]